MTYNYNPYLHSPNYFNYNQPKFTQVSSREEAVVAPVDVIGGQPSYFYNKAKNEFYIKMCDIYTGTPIFKTYAELQPVENPTSDVSMSGNVNPYEKEFKHINEGIDSLHRLIQDMKEVNNDESVKYVKYASKGTESEDDSKPIKRKQSST